MFRFVLFLTVCVAVVAHAREIVRPNGGGVATVDYNSYGVPFISAATEADLFFAQGKVIAEQRLWQMELSRRLLGGTLSVVFGESTLSIDISQRRFNWPRVCRTNVERMAKEYRERLQFYVDGVNDYLVDVRANRTQLPPEYGKYGVPMPRDWTAAEAFYMVKLMAMGLSGFASAELSNQALVERLGRQRFDELRAIDPAFPVILPPYAHSTFGPDSSGASKSALPLVPPVKPTSNNSSAVLGDLKDSVREAIDALQRRRQRDDDDGETGLETLFAMLHVRRGMASNNWAVSGQHTDSGKPIVSNDPHLNFATANIMLLVGLNVTSENARIRNAFGASVVFGTGIAIGRNNDVSFGFTTFMADSQDLFEMVNRDVDGGDALPQYQHNGAWHRYAVRDEAIDVRGAAEPHRERYLHSLYGPVIVPSGGKYYSVRWSAFDDIDTTVAALYDQSVARNVGEWRAASHKWHALMWNQVYADGVGNIAMSLCGRVPIRADGITGDVPTLGNGTFDWQGYVPVDKMPFALNPAQGFLVSANNQPGRPEQLACPLPGPYASGFRAQRIIDMLMDRIADKQRTVDAEYMRSIQMDVTSLQYFYLKPTFEAMSSSSDRLHALQQWDGALTPESTVAPLFKSVMACLQNVTSAALGVRASSYTLERIFNGHMQHENICDKALLGGGGASACVQYADQCFASAEQSTPASRNYGRNHLALFAHLPVKPFEWTPRPFPVGGDGLTPHASWGPAIVSTRLGTTGFVYGGPVLRFIADWGETHSYYVVPPGQSGLPSSPHYQDMLQLWRHGQYIQM
jgi:penicillin G amidase